MKRYYVVQTFDRLATKGRYKYAVKDRKSGEFVSLWKPRKHAINQRDKLNAQEAALPGGQNKRLKTK